MQCRGLAHRHQYCKSEIPMAMTFMRLTNSRWDLTVGGMLPAPDCGMSEIMEIHAQDVLTSQANTRLLCQG
jgi:hypothetical protein